VAVKRGMEKENPRRALCGNVDPRNKYEASSRRIMTMTAGYLTRSANIRVINRRLYRLTAALHMKRR
jgi:hypothetical protein